MLQALSETDQLTGLCNRRKLDSVLYYEWARYLRYEQRFSVVLLDIDHFKFINDQYGHLEGDRVLKQVAKLIEKTIRQVDIAARWGGEEFLILCPNTSSSGANWLAEKLRTAVHDSDLLKNHPVTASFGIATVDTTATDIEQLIKQADDALYQAKHAGRNRVTVYSKVS